MSMPMMLMMIVMIVMMIMTLPTTVWDDVDFDGGYGNYEEHGVGHDDDNDAFDGDEYDDYGYYDEGEMVSGCED
jgi:hypothetical protein